jgi:hypothetical protein
VVGDEGAGLCVVLVEAGLAGLVCTVLVRVCADADEAQATSAKTIVNKTLFISSSDSNSFRRRLSWLRPIDRRR